MRVAYILSMFPCWSETFILREIIELQRCGIEVTVFSLRPCTEKLVQPEAARLVKQGTVVYPSPTRAVLRFIWCFLCHPFRVSTLLLDFRRYFRGSWASLAKSVASMVLATDFLPEMKAYGLKHIHAPWSTYPSTAALFCSRVAGYSFSFAARAHDLFLEDHALAVKFREAAFAQTITEYNRALICKRYPDLTPETVHVIHSALDPAVFACEQRLASPPLLLSVGRLVEIKGFADLIDACALLRERGVAFCCLIVGDGPLKQDLKDRVELHGLTSLVGVSDPVPQEEIRRLLSEASCFVLPCVTASDGNQDGIPNVLMEAMAAEVPVISCPTSGIPELVEHEVTGLLAEQRSPQAVAQAIERLLSDRDLRARLAKAGRVKVEHEFNIKKNAARLAALFPEGRDKPRRVLLIIDELEVGGTQRQVLELAKGLASRNVSVQVVYFRRESAAMLPDFEAAGIRCVLAPKRRRIDLLFLVRLQRMIANTRPEVVQTFSSTADLWGRAASVWAGVPVVLSSARRVGMRWITRLFDPFTTILVANSQAVKDSLIANRGIPAERIVIIPNGVNLSRYRILAGAKGANGRAIIGTACRLDSVKNLSCLLKATALLLASGTECRIEIAGNGPTLESLREEAQSLGVGQTVAFLGEQRDVPALLCRWDVAVLPSWAEGCSNFLMEAMAAKLPIVASDIPANRELLNDGQAGALFPPDSPQALADALRDLLTDRLRARRLGEQAGKAIATYSIESMIEKHVRLYEEMLHKAIPTFPSRRPGSRKQIMAR